MRDGDIEKAKVHFYGVKEEVDRIKNINQFNDQNINGEIAWGSFLLKTFPIGELLFKDSPTGYIYSILSTRDNPTEKKYYKNSNILYEKCIVEHVSGYRNSDPNILVSELWITLSTRQIITQGVIEKYSVEEHCSFNRSRFAYNDNCGSNGIIFQLSPNAGPQMYSFENYEKYQELLGWLKIIAEKAKDLVSFESEIFEPTDKILSEPWV